jgi:hypothetical protein
VQLKSRLAAMSPAQVITPSQIGRHETSLSGDFAKMIALQSVFALAKLDRGLLL